MAIRIVVVDDQSLMREGLQAILDLEDDMEVVGTAPDGQAACELCGRVSPDVVLMDIRMPEMDGVEATRLLMERDPRTRVIILTTFDEDDLIVKALQAGARTYLLKDLPAGKLVATIRAIMSGDVVMQPEIAARLVQRAAGREAEVSRLEIGETLTRREKGILSLMAEGLGNAEIAARLYLSEGTVKNHVSALYGKLGISDRTQAVLFAIKQGLV